MATLRKGKCYTWPTTRAYTRTSKFKNKAFIKGIPNSKLSRFNMGDSKKDFNKTIDLIADAKFYIRHNALESCRIVVNKQLNDKLGAKSYHFIIRSYPHHIMRENKILSGAGSDRLQTGMKHSFGKAIGRSAGVKKGTKIFSVETDENNVNFVTEVLKSVNSRLPGKTLVVVN